MTCKEIILERIAFYENAVQELENGKNEFLKVKEWKIEGGGMDRTVLRRAIDIPSFRSMYEDIPKKIEKARFAIDELKLILRKLEDEKQ